MASLDKSKLRTPKLMKVGRKEAIMIANGDERRSANLVCWPGQVEMEKQLTAAFEELGWKLTRAHRYDPEMQHGFIESQAQGDEIFDRKRLLRLCHDASPPRLGERPRARSPCACR